jgi:hypothetical protein
MHHSAARLISVCSRLRYTPTLLLLDCEAATGVTGMILLSVVPGTVTSIVTVAPCYRCVSQVQITWARSPYNALPILEDSASYVLEYVIRDSATGTVVSIAPSNGSSAMDPPPVLFQLPIGAAQ